MQFFITRPIFAAVCAAVILLAGLIAIPQLPVAQYPNIAPPQITVSSEYIGANAEAVEASVTNPLEESINGAEGMRYMSSQSSDDGSSSIVATFNLGRDINVALQDVQNRVNVAEGLLPAQVTQTGITVSKNSSSFVMALGLTSTNPKYDALFLSNFADRFIVPAIDRVKGVGSVIVFGERKYAMRLWLDPTKMQAYSLTADDVVNALEAQNVQVPAGAIGSQPAPPNQPYQLNVRVAGRLTTPAEFGDIIVKSGPNYLVRVSDIGRVELGAQDYSTDLDLNGVPAVGIGILQLSDANALQLSKGVYAVVDEFQKQLPAGVNIQIGYDSTVYVAQSIREVLKTLGIAIVLVVLVIFLFLQDWRTTAIPAITIPVSLLGTFALLRAFGFSINVLTLFGLTLATALVVDDAIVVIENIVRYVREHKQDPKTATPLAMAEITSAVIATSLVLLAVFVPVAFFPGTTGELYKQFALTIASTISISAFTALTLAPALAAMWLSPEEPSHGAFMRGVSRVIQWIRDVYSRLLPWNIAHRGWVLGGFVVLLGLTGLLLMVVPSAFVPDEDQGFFVVIAQGPPGSSLQYTDKFMRQAENIIRTDPNVYFVFSVSGFSFTGVGPNNGIMFVRLNPYDQRPRADQSAQAIIQEMDGKLLGVTGGFVTAFNFPAIQGAGNIGGFDLEVEDQGNLGIPALQTASYILEGAGNTDPELQSVFTTFNDNSPQVQLNIDRNAVQALNVNLGDVFDTLSVLIGSDYVNNFNYLNQSYRVYVQADAPFRSRIDDLNKYYVRSADGVMVPLSALLTVQHVLGPPTIYHYNLFRSMEFNGQPKPGFSSGQALAEMQRVLARSLPPGMTYEWTGSSLDQVEAGSATVLIFGLAVVFVFLVLAAQYESLVDPLIIILAVPLAILGALGAVWLRGLQNDIFTQIGLVMLVGLASKNAILIVQFGNLLRKQGMPVAEAAVRAAKTRLRPILMTSFAFIFGIMPLVFASGAGQNARHSIGTAVVGGMLVSTLLNLLVTPLLYILIAGWEERMRERRSAQKARPASQDIDV
ncbi:MAG TPA: efflux RND transporter permease subunit [Candidatus Eremiobacteraceae bacterium]|nr:efflux RND transporter permease subunit [Candidatus Eremiobacteraceae bacterium]